MLVRRAVGSSVAVTFDLAPDLWFCRADPNQWGSALLNLAINARDAMPTGGTLSVTTRNVSLDGDAVTELGEIAPGRYATITLRDNRYRHAQGRPRACIRAVLYNQGSGKGFGARSEVKFMDLRANRADTSLYRGKVGEGTAVRLYLPWTEPSPAAVSKEKGKTACPVEGLNKILIVEDNDELRELATQIVEGLGYTVCSASTGAEALATLAQDPKIDLLFTDVLMPGGMTGFELALEIRRTRPEIAILVTSGFPGNLLAGAQQPGGFEIIPKPFTQVDLAAAFARARGQSVAGLPGAS